MGEEGSHKCLCRESQGKAILIFKPRPPLSPYPAPLKLTDSVLVRSLCATSYLAKAAVWLHMDFKVVSIFIFSLTLILRELGCNYVTVHHFPACFKVLNVECVENLS